jgi:hypothetical protein
MRTNRQTRISNFITGYKEKYGKTVEKKKKKKRYPRDESIYNLGQENEFPLFLEWMPIVAMHVAAKHDRDRYCGVGAPHSYSLYDILVCLAIYRYFHLSSRRSIGVIKFIVWAAKLHVKVPCFKTLNNYMKDSSMKQYLDEVIEITSRPTRFIEEFFATDSTCAATLCFTMWFMLRMKRKVRKRDHITAHVTTGTKTNIVTAVDVSCKKGGDNIYFRKHVDKTVKNFKPEEWSGDSTYLTRKNCNKCEEYGIEPYFRLKDNTTTLAKGSPAWKRMTTKDKKDKKEYGTHYHKRSNVESTNSGKSRKFNGFVRAKNDVAKENEEMFGWVDYNFSALARAYYQHPGMLHFDW